jgi:hypothetical protein
MRRTTTLVVTGLLVVGIAACGGDSNALANNRRWARGFCTGLARWHETTTSSSVAVQKYLESPNLDATAAKASLANYLGDASKATDQLRRDLHKAGAPDIANGGEAVRALEHGSAAVGGAFRTAKDQVAALAVGDTAQFQAGLKRVDATLTKGFKDFGASLDRLNRLDGGKELVRAERSVAACRSLLS